MVLHKKTGRDPEDSARDGLLRFVFLTRKDRDLWEARSIPGNMLSSGASREAALKRLEDALEAAFAVSGSPLTWYRRAWDRLLHWPDQKKFEAAIWLRLWQVKPSVAKKFAKGAEYTEAGDKDAKSLAGAC